VSVNAGNHKEALASVGALIILRWCSTIEEAWRCCSLCA
jgi:hypothetical protein